MKVEYDEFKKNTDKYLKIGMTITVHIFKDGQKLMDLVPVSRNDSNLRLNALNKFAGAIKNPQKTAEEYKEERLMEH